jgi:hypothetical protein
LHTQSDACLQKHDVPLLYVEQIVVTLLQQLRIRLLDTTIAQSADPADPILLGRTREQAMPQIDNVSTGIQKSVR